MNSRSGASDAKAGKSKSRKNKTTTAQAEQANWQRVMARHMRDAVLPGDTPFKNTALAAATKFVLSAAETREPGRSSLAIKTEDIDRRCQRIAIINDDMPFLVDSIAGAIAQQGMSIERLVHPIVPVRRNAKGALTNLNAKQTSDDTRESMIYIETERADEIQLSQLEKELRITLGDVRAAVEDWPKARAAMHDDADRISNAEDAALLHWFNDGMLTQLGHLTRKRDGSQIQCLGNLSQELAPIAGRCIL